MYRAIKTEVVAANTAAVKFSQAGIGDKALVYLAIEGAAAVTVTIAEVGGGTSLFAVPATEDWLFGPILGEDLESMGLEQAAGAQNINVTYLTGRPSIDLRSRIVTVDDNAPIGIGQVPLTWRKLN